MWGRRRRLVGTSLILIAATLTGCGSSPVKSGAPVPKSPTPLSVSVFPNSIEVMMMSVAQDGGFFQKNGLKVQQVPLTNGPALVTSVLSGSVDIGDVVNGIGWPVIKKGQGITALVGNGNGWFNLIGQNNLPLHNATRGDLSQLKKIKGMTVGVAGLGAAQQIAIEIMLADEGLPTDWVTWVAVGGPTTAVAAFKAHKIDLLSSTPPEDQLIGSANLKYAARMAYYGKFDTLLDYYAAKPAWVQQHPTEVNAFCTSMAEAHKFAVNPANRAKILPMLQTTLGVTNTPELISIYNHYMAKTFTLQITPTEWQHMAIWEKYSPYQGYVPSYSQYVSSSCQNIVKRLGG